MRQIVFGLVMCIAVAGITMAQAPVTVTPASAVNGAGTTIANLVFAPDNTFDIGASGATRPRNIFAAGNLLVSGGVGVNATPVQGALAMAAATFATLGTPTNGTFFYCSDCTIANPCASGGTGAFAKRLNGVWVCN